MAKKQKGLSIKRDGTSSNFDVSWKIGESGGYSDQKLEWWEVYLKTTDDPSKNKRYEGTHNKVDLTKKATSYKFWVNFAKYPPGGTVRLCYLVVRIAGKKNKKWSAWVQATFDIIEPLDLTALSHPAPVGNTPNAAVYSWQINDTGGNRVYYRCQYQAVERPGAMVKNINDVIQSPWSRASVNNIDFNSNSVSIPISALPSGTNTTTQCFRVRAYGPQGFSNWLYSWHVFGVAPKAKNVSVKTVNSPNGYIATVTWETVSQDYNSPVDSTVVEYIYATPVITSTTSYGITKFQITCPTVTGWTKKTATVDTSGYDSLTFAIDGRLAANQCMFVRVNNLHDFDETTRYGDIVLVRTSGITCGTLSLPVLRSVDYNPTTNRVTVEVDNTTGLENSYTSVFFKKNQETELVIGIIPYSASTASQTFVVPALDPGDSYKFGVRTYVADYTAYPPLSDGTCTYSMDAIYMMSDMEWRGGTIPAAPKVSLASPESGTILVEWDWPWAEAQAAELSWSKDPNAWESTDEPTRYVVSNNQAARWRIPNLDFDRWYVRVRLIQRGENYENYGMYSDTAEIDILAGSPPTPLLTVDPLIVTEDGEVSFYWIYSAEDGSNQLQADIVEVTSSGQELVYGDAIVSAGTAQSLKASVADLGWHAGDTHRVALRTTSSYKTMSNYSDLVTIQVADPLVVSAELGQGFRSYQEGGQTFYELNSFPFTVNVVGAGADGKTGLAVQRAYQYPLERPDESDIVGYEGETIIMISDAQTGSITVEANDPNIIGSFDDTQEYILTVNATDTFGQRGKDVLRFRVNWDHKATIPSASVLMDYTNGVAVLTPIPNPSVDYYISEDHAWVEAESVEPEVIGEMEFSFSEDGNLIYTYDDAAFTDFYLDDGNLYATTDSVELGNIQPGDVCDIYRLSADKPELVYSGAQFGEVYVDPYPTIGRFGGYRFVYRTAYNDFITSSGMLGWTDYTWEDGATLDIFTSIINFDDDQVVLPFNLDLGHKWTKDFTETKYLGGAIQGDWNPAVSHTVTMHTDVAVEYYSETFLAMRRLARYAGICHVRTPDGSSFAANVNVSEDREEKKISMIARFSLDITRVDQEREDGLTWAEWVES